jgi:hypothetical protein
MVGKTTSHDPFFLTNAAKAMVASCVDCDLNDWAGIAPIAALKKRAGGGAPPAQGLHQASTPGEETGLRDDPTRQAQKESQCGRGAGIMSCGETLAKDQPTAAHCAEQRIACLAKIALAILRRLYCDCADLNGPIIHAAVLTNLQQGGPKIAGWTCAITPKQLANPNDAQARRNLGS